MMFKIQKPDLLYLIPAKSHLHNIQASLYELHINRNHFSKCIQWYMCFL